MPRFSCKIRPKIPCHQVEALQYLSIRNIGNGGYDTEHHGEHNVELAL